MIPEIFCHDSDRYREGVNRLHILYNVPSDEKLDIHFRADGATSPPLVCLGPYYPADLEQN